MIDAILQISTATACGIIVWRAEGHISHMDSGTDMGVRLSFFCILVYAAIGVAAIALSALRDLGVIGEAVGFALTYTPAWRDAISAWGVAGIMLCERRIRLLSKASDRRGPA